MCPPGPAPVKTYSGSCHCGAVRFSVRARITHLRECDCSICAMRATLNVRVANDALELQTSLAELTTYRWGSYTAIDYFCGTCGVLTFRRPGAPTAAEHAAGIRPFDGWAVNARCLIGLDLSAFPRKFIHGKNLRLDSEISGT